MRSLRSRIVATAVAVATFSSVVVAPQALAVEEPSDTSFVQEQSGTDTVDVNGTTFDDDGNLIDSNNAGDNIIEELDRESRGNDFGFYGAENGKPTTLDELKTAEASTADATIKVVEKNGKLVCEITDVPGKEGEILERKLDLAWAFYDGGNKLLQTVWEVIPVVGELVPSDFIKKIGASSWKGIAKLVRDGEAEKDVTWDLARAQGMAIAKIDNADAEVDLKNPDAAKKTVSGLIKFADGAFGSGVATVLKIFNAAVTIAGLFPGASAAKDLKLTETQRKEIESTLSGISASASALAEINAPAGQKCADMLNGKKVSNDKPASPSTSKTTEPTETTKPSETPTTTEPSTSTIDGAEAQDGKDGKDGEPGRDGKDGKDGVDGKDGRDGANGAPGAPGRDGVDGQDGRDGLNGLNGRDGADGKDGKDGQDGKDVDSSSMAGYTFLAAILGGGLVVSILGAMDYLYLLGYLPKEGIPWRANS